MNIVKFKYILYRAYKEVSQYIKDNPDISHKSSYPFEISTEINGEIYKVTVEKC